MQEHPIQGLMSTAMENIRQMVDVNTIVGDAVQCPDGSVIIPISKVSFGFAAGGGEYGEQSIEKPFAGGSGAGISISPVAFMVVGKEQVKLLPINAPGDRAIEMAASVADKMADWVKGKFQSPDFVGQEEQQTHQAHKAHKAHQYQQAQQNSEPRSKMAPDEELQ